ncbi:MAG: metallophosphoesterase [Candidatus Bathyarchaeia archaeon]
MSDTHDNLPLIDKAIEQLNREAVEVVLHAGDYISPFAVTHFKKLTMKLIGVFGNNDGDHELLKNRFAALEKAEVRGNFAELDLDGLKTALLHGEESGLLRSLINTNSYDVVVHGHSHEAAVYKQSKTLVINPGEVCGYLSGKSTVAILDTVAREARIVQL